METKEYKVLIIELKNDEIENFKSIFSKIAKENSKIGFDDKKFNGAELDIIKKLSNE